MNGLFEGPSADWEYRNYLKSIAMKEGLNALHRMLADIDPEAASKLHFNDQRGHQGTRSIFKRQGKVSRLFRHNLGVIILNITAWRLLIMIVMILYKRIEARGIACFSEDLINEKTLLNNPLIKQQASQALGYKEIIDFFNGKCTLSEATDVIKRNTR